MIVLYDTNMVLLLKKEFSISNLNVLIWSCRYPFLTTNTWHESIATTEIYTHVDEVQLQAAVNSNPVAMMFN